jgi:predicted transcriptional regulator
MRKSQIELTEAEWAIIQAVWEAEPCTAPAVREKLRAKTGWAYSTVRTLLDRMVGKGLLSADRRRHVTVFRSAVTRQEAQRSELLYALKHAFAGALTPMVQCLLETGDLSADDLARLEELIKAKRKAACPESRGARERVPTDVKDRAKA